MRVHPKRAESIFLAAVAAALLLGLVGTAWQAMAATGASPGEWEQAISDLTEAIEREPEAWPVRKDRAKAYAMLGRWKQAADDLAVLVKHLPDDDRAWCALGALWLKAGDEEAYKRTCREAFQQLADGHKWHKSRLVQMCSLAADCGIDRRQLTPLADSALNEDDNNKMHLAKGMDDYRSGRFEQAVAQLPRSGDAWLQPLTHFFRAMSHHRLGDAEQAQQELGRGLQAMQRKVPTIDGPPLAGQLPDRWLVWCVVDVVRREAQETIVGLDLARLMGRLVRPPYAPRGELAYVDLRPQANKQLSDGVLHSPGNNLQALPRGEQTLAGVKFDVADGYIQLGSPGLPDRPNKVEGIAVDRTLARLYVFHGTLNRRAPSKAPMSPGTLIGQYQLHYADGGQETIPLVLRQNVCGWWVGADYRDVPAGAVGWVGTNELAARQDRELTLYVLAWKNPQPEKKVVSIDYLSAGTDAAPFCLAITAEGP